MDKVLQYMELLHRHQDPDSQEVRAFVGQYAADEVFADRVRKLNALFLLQAAAEPVEIAPDNNLALV